MRTFANAAKKPADRFAEFIASGVGMKWGCEEGTERL